MPNEQQNIKRILFLAAGLASISMASVLIKLCAAPAMVISAYRLSIASVFYLSLLKLKKRAVWSPLTFGQRKWLVLSGIFLSFHFITWITSLQYTTVAASVVLVQTAPVFVALGGFLFIREKPSRISLLGILFAIIGCLIISHHEFNGELSSLQGNALALMGAICAAGYLLVGRKLRAQMDTIHYVGVVYSVAAIVTLFLTLAAGFSLHDYSAKTFVLFLAIAIFPQIIGHTSLNWALKYFTATSVSILTLAEPIGAALLAFFILHEPVGLLTGIGGAVIILGVVMTLSGEKNRPQSA